ncbi:MAG: quinone-dependent dihydroorotate dehydrogenase [Chloroflexi bacterium]|nr:quinone-dependent dihydroorotate dehydrogenase [Chloroflexota bacterium]
MNIYGKIRPFLFGLDPECAHNLILGLIRTAGSITPIRQLLRRIFIAGSSRPVSIAGLSFQNPVGLAAGYDKNGTAWQGMASLGFGHLELGTVTPLPQAGNPKPRIFRLPHQEAIINRMGFPGRGVDYMMNMIPSPGSSPERDRIILGINIGKNKDTENQYAVQDYLKCLKLLATRADYFAINVSSPNTIGLRKLQRKEYLQVLLRELIAERDRLRVELKRPLPVFVKLSPDLSDQELDDALEAISGSSADGVIVANTTIQREVLLASYPEITGGLSGKPIKELNTIMIRKIHRRTGGRLPIIGVGGINSVEDAREKMDAGATLVQIYSGLIFHGPGLVRDLVENL